MVGSCTVATIPSECPATFSHNLSVTIAVLSEVTDVLNLISIINSMSLDLPKLGGNPVTSIKFNCHEKGYENEKA